MKCSNLRLFLVCDGVGVTVSVRMVVVFGFLYEGGGDLLCQKQ